MAQRITLKRLFGPELRVWHGQAALRVAFWGYGVGASALIASQFVIAYYFNKTAILQALVILAALYTVWILVGIWRCAANSTSVLADIARMLTIAWALNVSLVLVFMQFDLLLGYLAG